MPCKCQVTMKAAAENSRSSRACLNIRSETTIFVVSPLSRQSVHRAVEAAQVKCVLVTKVSANECFGKLGNRRAECANSDSSMERCDGVIHQAGERATNVMCKSL